MSQCRPRTKYSEGRCCWIKVLGQASGRMRSLKGPFPSSEASQAVDRWTCHFLVIVSHAVLFTSPLFLPAYREEGASPRALVCFATSCLNPMPRWVVIICPAVFWAGAAEALWEYGHLSPLLLSVHFSGYRQTHLLSSLWFVFCIPMLLLFFFTYSKIDSCFKVQFIAF